MTEVMVRRRLVARLVIAAGLFSGGYRAAAQTLEVKIGGYEAPEAQIVVLVSPVRTRGWVEVPVERLEGYRVSSIPPYSLYYDYTEHLLITDPETPGYLHVHVVDLNALPAADSSVRRVWSEKFRIEVLGSFIDRTVELDVTIRDGDEVSQGTIRVNAHHSYPVTALEPEMSETPKVEIWTGERSELELRYANLSCCPVRLLGDPRLDCDSKLWRECEAEIIQRDLAPGDPTRYQPGVLLKLEPNSWAAFWETFSPFEKNRPHTSMRVVLDFEVREGAGASLRQPIDVRFRPGYALVGLSVILGAFASASLSLLIIGVSKDTDSVLGKAGSTCPKCGRRTEAARALADPVSGEAPSTWAKFRKVVKTIIVRIAVALVIFLVFLLVKGETKVILFDFSLDPTQCLPAFVIGLLVGLRPLLWWRLITRWSEKAVERARGGVAPVLLWVAVLGILAPEVAGAAGDFRPVSLAFDSSSQTLYVLSSPENAVYSLETETGELRQVTELEAVGTATDACLLRRDGELWLASVHSRRTSSIAVWRGSLSMTPLSLGSEGRERGRAIRRSFLRFGRFHSVAFDSERGRLLLTDPTRAALYAVAVTAKGLGDPELVFGRAALSQPSSILAYEERVFVGDAGREQVFELDPATGEVRILGRDVIEPAGLALSTDGTELLVADAGGGQILEIDLESGRVRVLLEAPELEEPAAVVVDSRGHVWVADRWAAVVFEFAPGSARPKRYAP